LFLAHLLSHALISSRRGGRSPVAWEQLRGKKKKGGEREGMSSRTSTTPVLFSLACQGAQVPKRPRRSRRKAEKKRRKKGEEELSTAYFLLLLSLSGEVPRCLGDPGPDERKGEEKEKRKREAISRSEPFRVPIVIMKLIR